MHKAPARRTLIAAGGPGGPTDARPSPPAVWLRASAWADRHRVASTGCGYLLSAAGVGVVTWLISLVLPRYHVVNISMTYLLLVLALAVGIGSGPAVLASVLSFLAYDWFFVPPVGRLTVDDPSEWLALFLFLVVAIISSQLAAGLHRRAEEARRRARETTTLYELSMEILGDARLERVLPAIAERTLLALGLRNVAIFLLDAQQRPDLAAEAGESLSVAELRERELNARWAVETRSATDRYVRAGGARSTRPLARRSSHTGEGELLVATYVPLLLGRDLLGVVAAIRAPDHRAITEQPGHLLQALVAQTALAIGRARLAEEEEKARSAAESERMKSTFLASVSHDLRTPLTAIKAAAEGLRLDADARADVEHRDLAASIDREVARLDRLVGNLLEISRIESGGLPLRKAPEDLSEIVGSVVSRLGSLLGDRHLHIAISDGLPLLVVDAVEMERVFTNLLENAVKFSPEGSEITLSAAREGSRLRITVHNKGAPLPDRARERIFDKFYQLNNDGRAPRGVGLGLTICKGIVEGHGGRIRAENDDDGVSFVVELPLSESESESESESVPVREGTG